MAKKVLVFFEFANVKDSLEQKSDYLTAYHELGIEMSKIGLELWMCGSQENYLGGGEFQHTWKFEITHEPVLVFHENVLVDLVFDKGRFVSDGKIKVFNPDFINQICTNKWLTYQKFDQFCPKTILANNQADLQVQLANISSDQVIVKPVDGAEGRDVLVKNKSEILNTPISFPVIISEFVDSSGGIPGIVAGSHDFRVAVLNGEIIYSEYKTPPNGSLIASVSRGGSYSAVEIGQIPTSALEIVRQVDAVMAVCPQRFYGVDVMFSPTGPKITELNSRMGLLPNKDGKDFTILKQKLAETFSRIISDQ
jgi:glutathione synthase/RimK-type ligase-like ATP-grasp enzyme